MRSARTPRAIDHLVLPVTTLTLARSRLTSLGFTVAPDARHPFGTGNCCVFFEDRTFLEPITILDRTAADMAAAEGVIFVKRIKRFTERHGEGFAMVALKSEDAEADHAAFRASRDSAADRSFASRARRVCRTGPSARSASRLPTPSSRRRPTRRSSPASTSPRASSSSRPISSIRTARPAWRQWLRGRRESGRLPATFCRRDRASEVRTDAGLEAGAEARASSSYAGGFRARYGLEPPDTRRGLLFAAFEITVSDLERAVGYAGPTATRHDGRIVVPPSPGLGAVARFPERG